MHYYDFQKQASSDRRASLLFYANGRSARKGNRMYKKPQPPLTEEELALVRALNAQYMREYRAKNKDKIRAQQQRAKLKRAKKAIAAGTLEDPNAAKAQPTE